jgi:predicted exporter
LIRRYAAFGIWLACVAACVLIISRTPFTADMSAFLPRSPTPTQQMLVEQLREGVVSRLILVGVENLEPQLLAQLSKDLASRLRLNDEFNAVNNGEQIDNRKDADFLWRNRYLLSFAVTPQRFSTDGLRASLTHYLDLLGTPLGSMAQRILPNDPSGELIDLLEQFEGQAKPNRQDDVWFSHDGKRALLLLHTRSAGADIDAQERALNAVQAAFTQAKQAQPQFAPARLHMTGPGVFAVQSRAGIRDDAWRLSLIATLLVASMLLALYRSPRVLALGLFPVASGALAGVAAVSLGFGSVHGLTLAFGVTLIGECVDYAIYLFTQITPESPPRRTFQRIWPTLRLGVLTSICGFSAMLFSGFTGLAQLGLFSIAGLLAAVATTRWVVPQLLPDGFFVRSDTRLSRWVMHAVRLAPRARWPVLIAVVIAALFLVSRPGPLWNDSLASMSPVPDEMQQLDAQLRRDLGAPDVRYLIVSSGPDQQSVLQQSEALATVLRRQVQQGLLESFDAPTLYFPSRQTQQARQAALPDEPTLRRNLQLALHGLPFRDGLFEPFVQDVAQARRQALLDPAALKGTSLGLKLDSFLIKRENGWAVMLPLSGVKDKQALVNAIRSQSQAPMLLLDMKQESEQMFRDYRREASKYASLGALSIAVLLLASLRSIRRVGVVSLPLLAAVIVVTAGLVISGHLLSLFHLIGLLLVVAIGSNYALFFERSAASEQERTRTMTSLVFANLSTMCGFGLLSFSQSPVLIAIGSTVAAGTVLSLIFSAVLVRKPS